MKSVAPALEIKLPVPSEGRREGNTSSSASQVQLKQPSEERGFSPSATPISTNIDDLEEGEDDEDDWDTFQSFPATKDITESDSVVENVAEEVDPDKNDSFAENSEVATEMISDGSGDSDSTELVKILSNPVIDHHENEDQEKERELLSSPESEASGSLINEKEKIQSDCQVVEEMKESYDETDDHEKSRDNRVTSTEPPHSEGSVNVVKNHEHQDESPDDKVDSHFESDAQPPKVLLGNETEEEADGKIDQLQRMEAGEDVRK